MSDSPEDLDLSTSEVRDLKAFLRNPEKFITDRVDSEGRR